MENAQVLAVSLSLVLFLFAAVSSDTCERFFYSSLVLLCVTFLLRELDMEDYGLHPVITGLTSGPGRNLLLGFLWAYFLLLFLRGPQDSSRVLYEWIRSLEGRLMMAAGFFFLSAWPLDREMFQMSSHTSRVLEELLELNGYFLFGLSSVSTYLHKVKYKRLAYIRGAVGATGRSQKSATVDRSFGRFVLTQPSALHPEADREKQTKETVSILGKRISRLPGAAGKGVVRRKP
jgi:hypothetical protein